MLDGHTETWAFGIILWVSLLGAVLTAGGGKMTVRVLRQAPRFGHVSRDHFGNHEWRARLDHDRRPVDWLWRWMFPLVLLLAVVGGIVTLILHAGAAAWLWGHVS
jgi:hypothetical protein